MTRGHISKTARNTRPISALAFAFGIVCGVSEEEMSPHLISFLEAAMIYKNKIHIVDQITAALTEIERIVPQSAQLLR